MKTLCSKLVWLAVIAVASAGLSTAHADGRPSNVPADYVITPFGYFHSSCVREVAASDKELPDGRITHSDGTTDENPPVCQYPHYAKDGSLILALQRAQKPVPESSAASSAADQTSLPFPVVSESEGATVSQTNAYGGLSAYWRVPNQPAADDGQTLFFWPGITGSQSVIQPVLTWSAGKWTISSWNCCLSGTADVSPSVKVKSGDQIYGAMTSNCPAGTVSCHSWTVAIEDVDTNKSSALVNTPSDGQIFNYAQGAYLEPYYVVSCNDYPTDGAITFTSVQLLNLNKKLIDKPKWVIAPEYDVTNPCDGVGSVVGDSISLDF